MSTAPSRFSTYGYVGNNGGNNAHPLSNAMYMDSSPTLAGSDNMSPGDEKMRMDAGDRLGDYTGPRDTSPTNNAPYRRGQQATGFTAFYRSISGANIADSGKDERHVKLPRLGYLDGLKFFAAWLVLNGTFFDAVLTGSDYSFIQRNSPLYITRCVALGHVLSNRSKADLSHLLSSTGLGITFLLLLSGRSLVTPLWDVPIPTNNGNGASNKTKSALISWARLTRAMLVRVFRFLLPVLAVVALQWGLASTGKTANCNAVGMDEPYWGMITNFAGFATLVFNLVRLLSPFVGWELDGRRGANGCVSTVHVLRVGHARRSDFLGQPLDRPVVLPVVVRRLRDALHARQPLVEPLLGLRDPVLL